MGKMAASMLISLIKGEDEKVEKKVVLPAKLIIRESA
jgi:DNA-binding LacI/PurR family transcriptional regulator